MRDIQDMTVDHAFTLAIKLLADELERAQRTTAVPWSTTEASEADLRNAARLLREFQDDHKDCR